jgi:hypothetical protein
MRRFTFREVVVDGGIILKYTLKKQVRESVGWIELFQNSV